MKIILLPATVKEVREGQRMVAEIKILYKIIWILLTISMVYLITKQFN